MVPLFVTFNTSFAPASTTRWEGSIRISTSETSMPAAASAALITPEEAAPPPAWPVADVGVPLLA